MLVVKSDGQGIKGIIMLQVDDSLGLGTETFMKDEERASMYFHCKPRQIVK